MTGVSRPAWHDHLKHLLTASEMSRDWGHWRSVGKWGLVVRGLVPGQEKLLSCC